MDSALAGERRFNFRYFPENYMWSQGMMLAIEMARWGGSAISEVDRVGRRLKDRLGDNDAWGAEWEAEARRVEQMGDDAVAGKRYLTAGAHYLRAAVYYFCGERFVPLGAKKLELYKSCLRCFRLGIRWRYPGIERVEVPSSAGTLPAWFMKARGVPGRAPAVCFFDGLDAAKELSILFGGVELANRGIHTLAIDGPGQGEALRLQNIPSRHDYEVPAAAAYDYVASRADVDPGRVAVMAFSMGGYYAPRATAFEKRFAACVAWGAHFDYHANWVKRRKQFESGGTRVSAPHYQLPWVLGVADMDAAMRKLEKYTLAGVAERIECPTLVMHGERDTLSPVETAHQLYNAVGSKVKTLKIFTAEEGGAEHCQTDNRLLGANYVADWLAETLKATPPQL
ncbi:MAG: alpha/beta fold hydrolase [Betaproteobacteria bacterium]|nr:alpha/beta fold hydrolase [Betaproteobacteria bacterium]